MRNILITGGSGFIGTNTMEFYLSKGENILNIDIVEPLNPKYVKYWKKCDINDFESLSKVVADFKPTDIIHLAAATGLDVKDISHFKTNFDGLETLISVCNNSSTIKRAVFTSSLLVCERSYKPRNSTDYKPDSLYGESKVLSEKIVSKSNLRIKWSIVRPTAVWGPWFRSSYTTFFKLILKGFYVNPGAKELNKPATYVGNTVYMIDEILKSDKSNKNVFYLADYPPYTIQEWSNTIASLGEKAKPITIPRFIINSFAKIGDFIKYIKLNSDPPLTSFRLSNIITGVDYDLKNTVEIVGDLPYDLNNAVDLTLKWMKKK